MYYHGVEREDKMNTPTHITLIALRIARILFTRRGSWNRAHMNRIIMGLPGYHRPARSKLGPWDSPSDA